MFGISQFTSSLRHIFFLIIKKKRKLIGSKNKFMQLVLFTLVPVEVVVIVNYLDLF